MILADKQIQKPPASVPRLPTGSGRAGHGAAPGSERCRPALGRDGQGPDTGGAGCSVRSAVLWGGGTLQTELWSNVSGREGEEGSNVSTLVRGGFYGSHCLIHALGVAGKG